MFDSNSRYAKLDTAQITDAEGRVITYVRRRFLPQGADLSLLVEVTVDDADRLDLISSRTLGSSEAWWWIADANDALCPSDLLEVGERLRVPVPRL